MYKKITAPSSRGTHYLSVVNQLYIKNADENGSSDTGINYRHYRRSIMRQKFNVTDTFMKPLTVINISII